MKKCKILIDYRNEKYHPKTMKYSQLNSNNKNIDYQLILQNSKKIDERKMQFKEIKDIFKGEKHPHYDKYNILNILD